MMPSMTTGAYGSSGDAKKPAFITKAERALRHSMELPAKESKIPSSVRPKRDRCEEGRDRERSTEFSAIKEQYLGFIKPKKRVIKPSQKFRFSFEWENAEDTSRDMDYLYDCPHEAIIITQPHGEGRGAVLAMSRALKQSGLSPNQVDYINAHATSTSQGDAVEAKAILSLFCNHAASGALALSSTKGAIGHLLGAAGAVEALFSILAIHHGIAPLTLNLTKPDPIFSGDFMPLTASKKMDIKAAMSNSFGFGGTNSALLFTSLE